MDRIRIYFLAYFFSLPVFIISLFIRELQGVYILIYFLAGGFTVFTFVQPVENPEHSTTTHFDRASRWNIVSYIIIGFLIVSALVVLYVPVSPILVTFTLWTLAATIGTILIRRASGKLIYNLFVEYISGQLPNVNKEVIQKAVTELFINPGLTEQQLAAGLKVDVETTQKILHFFNVYKHNNSL